MKSAISFAISFGIAASVLAQPAKNPSAPNPDSQYRLGPDSLRQDGVPHGEIRENPEQAS